MTRVTSILLLAVLALPYARTPICSSAGHEHERDDHHGAHTSVVADNGHMADGNDCHRLMACDTTLQGVTPAEAAPSRSGPRLAARGTRTPVHHEGPTRAPIPPPPQSV